jgi:hypothetical protein
VHPSDKTDLICRDPVLIHGNMLSNPTSDGHGLHTYRTRRFKNSKKRSRKTEPVQSDWTSQCLTPVPCTSRSISYHPTPSSEIRCCKLARLNPHKWQKCSSKRKAKVIRIRGFNQADIGRPTFFNTPQRQGLHIVVYKLMILHRSRLLPILK